MPPVTWRENQAVSPVRVMRNETAAGGPADQRTQQSQARDLGVFLRITERRAAFGPTVKTQYGLAQLRCELQQRFIQCHVEGCRPRTGIEQQPGFRFRIYTSVVAAVVRTRLVRLPHDSAPTATTCPSGPLISLPFPSRPRSRPSTCKRGALPLR